MNSWHKKAGPIKFDEDSLSKWIKKTGAGHWAHYTREIRLSTPTALPETKTQHYSKMPEPLITVSTFLQ
jgi:hypothetical protein